MYWVCVFLLYLSCTLASSCFEEPLFCVQHSAERQTESSYRVGYEPCVQRSAAGELQGEVDSPCKFVSCRSLTHNWRMLAEELNPLLFLQDQKRKSQVCGGFGLLNAHLSE